MRAAEAALQLFFAFFFIRATRESTARRFIIGALVREGASEREAAVLAALQEAVRAHNERQRASDSVHIDLHVVRLRHDHNIIIGKTACAVLSKGISLLVGTTASPFILSFSRTLHLPYLSLGATAVTAPDRLKGFGPSGRLEEWLRGASVATGGSHWGWIPESLGITETLGFSKGAGDPWVDQGGVGNTGWVGVSRGGGGAAGAQPRPVGLHHSAGGRREESFSLFLRPTTSLALVDVVRFYGWGRVVFLYDSPQGLSRLEGFLSGHNFKPPLVIDSLRLRDVTVCYTALRKVDQSYSSGSERYIVLDIGTLAGLQQILRQIQVLGMNRANYHYLLSAADMYGLDLGSFRYGGVNITGFSLIDPHYIDPSHWPPDEQTKTEDLSMEQGLARDAVLLIVASLQSALHSRSDVIRSALRGRVPVYNQSASHCVPATPTPLAHGPIMMRHLKQVRFDGHTGPVGFDELGRRAGYNLRVLELNVDAEIAEIGVWGDRNGLNITKHLLNTLDLNTSALLTWNRTKIVTTIYVSSGTLKVYAIDNLNFAIDNLHSEPYLMDKTKAEEGEPLLGNNRYYGYCADLAEEVARLLGFGYELRIVADNKYGVQEGGVGGEWSGMVGELIRGEADLAIAPLTITSMRERVIDFSKPFMDLGISIMIKKPEKQKPSVFSFTAPLHPYIWLCIIVAYLAVSLSLFFVSRCSPYEWMIDDRVNQGPSFTNDFSLQNSLWFALGAFMRQGCDISPRSLSGRVVGSSWWFFTLIIISSYTANLAAFLTVERMLTPISSADDLAKQTEILYGCLDSGSTRDFFKLSKIPTYVTMWEYMSRADPTVFVKRTIDGVTRVRSAKGKYAFLLESTMNEYHNQRLPCNTMKVGGNLDAKGYGIATPLGSPLREPVGLAVLNLLESGVLQKFHKKWWFDKGECGQEEKTGTSQGSLTLSNVAGIFYILITGLGLSLLMSLLEFACKARNRMLIKKQARAKTACRNASFYTHAANKRGDQRTYAGPLRVVALNEYTDVNRLTAV